MEEKKNENLGALLTKHIENKIQAKKENGTAIKNFDEVKNMIDDYLIENDTSKKKIFSDSDFQETVFICRAYDINLSFDDAKQFIKDYLLENEKISYSTLCDLFRHLTDKITLTELYDFISTYVQECESGNIENADLYQKMYFYRYRIIKHVNFNKDKAEENEIAIKYFSDGYKSCISSFLKITDGYSHISDSDLAIALLKFKTKTKISYDVKEIQDDILFYIKKISESQSNIKYNMKYYTLNGYLDKFINAKFIDRKQKQKILDSKFIKNIRDIILGDEKKIISCRQIWFLINILTINRELNMGSFRLGIKHSFDDAYNFVFGEQNKDTIKTIVNRIKYNKYKWKDFIKKCFLPLVDVDDIDINSKSFRDFCDIFGLETEEGHQLQEWRSVEPFKDQVESVRDTIKSNLSGYFLEQNEIEVKNINKVYITNQYGSELYFGEEKICDLESCISKKNEQKAVSCDIKILSSYKKNSRAYEIFAATSFLIFGFIPLIIFKSIFDILLLPVKVIINIFHSAIIAFKRKEYFWKSPDFTLDIELHRIKRCLGMFLHILIDLFVGFLVIVFSPIICFHNNFRGSKYLFHKSGTGQKLITFNNWRFYKEQSDSDSAKNFALTEINLWFVIKYILGCACLAKTDDESSELEMEFKLTNDNQIDTKSGILKLSENMLNKYGPSVILTNEYSPLSYLKTIK